MPALWQQMNGVAAVFEQRPSRDEFRGINCESPQAANLCAWWPMWESSGAYAMDYGPFGMHMTPSVKTLMVPDPQMGNCWLGTPTPAGTLGMQSWQSFSRPYAYGGPNTVDPVDFGALPNASSFSKPYMATAWVKTGASALTYTASDNPPDCYIYSFDRNDGVDFPGHTLGLIMQTPNLGSPPLVAAAAASMFDNAVNNDPFGAQSLQIVNDNIWHLICGIYLPAITSNFNNGFQYILVDGNVGFIGGIDTAGVGTQPFGFSSAQANLGSSQDATHAATTAVFLFVGADDDGLGSPMQGYISDHRIYSFAGVKYSDPLDLVQYALQLCAHMYAPETRWDLYRPPARIISYFALGAVLGSGAIVLSPIAASGMGTFAGLGTGAPTLGPLGASGTGTTADLGSGAIALGAMGISGTGSFATIATGAITLGPFGVAGTGSISGLGTGAITLGALGVSGTGSFAAIGSGAIALGALAVSGAGTLGLSGSGAIALGSIVVAGIGIAGGAGPAFVSFADPRQGTVVGAIGQGVRSAVVVFVDTDPAGVDPRQGR